MFNDLALFQSHINLGVCWHSSKAIWIQWFSGTLPEPYHWHFSRAIPTAIYLGVCWHSCRAISLTLSRALTTAIYANVLAILHTHECIYTYVCTVYMPPCSSGCIHLYVGIMTSEYSCNISEHVVWWLGNETVALLQSHPNEALALLQRHPKTKWHSYSANGFHGSSSSFRESCLRGSCKIRCDMCGWFMKLLSIWILTWIPKKIM